ncbi:hypothetical protein [Deefgea rivuli]|uniref:hypothetical protein n=1 Tax=Deefgea rivuli TaxID=400948 RepID=UPI0004898E36|nr:hypothetical protein [Deefgea rivuli]
MYSFETSTERNGVTYVASATVSADFLTVRSVTLGSKSASLSSNNEFLANLLLIELVNDAERSQLIRRFDE